MSAIIRELKDMTDSRELMEAKPHPIVAWFLVILLLLLSGGLAWTWFGEMDITVKANGIVRPNEKVSSVKNKAAGKVETVQYKAGIRVRQGDLLYTVDRSTAQEELRSLEAEKKRLRQDTDSLLAYRSRLAEGGEKVNVRQVNEELLRDYRPEHQLIMQQLSLVSQLQENRQTSGQLQLLEQSALQRTSLFADTSSEYYTRFSDYHLKLTKLEAEKRKSEDSFKNTLGDGDLAAAKRPLEDAQLAIEQYKNEFLLQIRSQVEDLRKKDRELELALSTLYSDLNNQIKQNEDKLYALADKQKMLTMNLDDYEVRSPADGMVQIVKEISQGELLQPGEEIVSIVPENGSTFIIQLSLPNRDVANIKEGDRIKYHFEALPYKEYGELEGSVSQISPDAVQGPDGRGSFYVVEADIENKPLYSHKGDSAQIRVGMVCEAYMVSESKKILYYLLEKIDLRE